MARVNANTDSKADTSQADPSNTAATISQDVGGDAEITIYPVRSYLDGQVVRRAGGEGYKSPKHDAVSLIAAGMATDKKPAN
ncbi:MAG TPA: hypothetical protein VGC62_27435 [Pseudomonas sp.]|uniref:hypothetical protein n=1 Tax=Pseudomonas sp. TaxID=306 RepID=UPI002EDA7A77